MGKLKRISEKFWKREETASCRSLCNQHHELTAQIRSNVKHGETDRNEAADHVIIVKLKQRRHGQCAFVFHQFLSSFNNTSKTASDYSYKPLWTNLESRAEAEIVLILSFGTLRHNFLRCLCKLESQVPHESELVMYACQYLSLLVWMCASACVVVYWKCCLRVQAGCGGRRQWRRL